MSLPPAQAAPAVPAPAAPVFPVPAQVTTQTPMLGDALAQLFGVFGTTFIDLLNPPLHPVTTLRLGDLGAFPFLFFFDVFGLCQGGHGTKGGPYGTTTIVARFQC
jgi:hypothetical protein